MLDDIGTIIRILEARIAGLLAVYRFGSAGNGQEHEGSDIDIGVLAKAPLDVKELWAAAEVLASALGRDVDLLDLRRASTFMQAQIISNGQRILDRDPATVANFETRVYAAYALLNEERQGILDDIARRGTVHGR